VIVVKPFNKSSHFPSPTSLSTSSPFILSKASWSLSPHPARSSTIRIENRFICFSLSQLSTAENVDRIAFGQARLSEPCVGAVLPVRRFLIASATWTRTATAFSAKDGAAFQTLVLGAVLLAALGARLVTGNRWHRIVSLGNDVGHITCDSLNRMR